MRMFTLGEIQKQVFTITPADGKPGKVKLNLEFDRKYTTHRTWRLVQAWSDGIPDKMSYTLAAAVERICGLMLLSRSLNRCREEAIAASILFAEDNDMNMRRSIGLGSR